MAGKKIEVQKTLLRDKALAYAREGWAVFPCEPRGKKPLTEHGLKDATTDPEKIRAWWTGWPDANIGHATGGLVALDVDGAEGEAALAALELERGALPETLTARTGKGRHLYFAPNGSPIKNSVSKLSEHLDIRAEGGYVILPPSVHVSGARYEWLTHGVKPAPMPAWIVALLSGPADTQMAERAAGKIPQGQRNAHLTSLAGSMRHRDMSQAAIEAALLKENSERCDPPLAEREVRAIAQSVGRYEPASKSDGPLAVPGVLASEVFSQSVAWLWANHIPFAKITLFDGDPGLAKSTVSLDLAARLTKGWPMPDGSECGSPPAGAVIVSLEDGVADTIRPRLEAAGASLGRVRIVPTIRGTDGIERTPTLPVDLPEIEAAIVDVKARLLVLDPLVAMLGAETNSYRDQDIRRVLAPVKELAEKTGVAVICIRHLNKSGGQNPKYRGGGSIGILGAGRASFLFGEKLGEEGRYVFAANKGNLWRGKPASLEYTIREVQVQIEGMMSGQPVIDWQGESIHNAASLLAQPESAEESNACADAKNFLVETLKDGPKDAKEIFAEARRARVSERTLYRAKASLGIMSRKGGVREGWEWSLPKPASAAPKAANNQGVAALGKAAETKPVNSDGSPKIAKGGNMAALAGEDGRLPGPDAMDV